MISLQTPPAFIALTMIFTREYKLIPNTDDRMTFDAISPGCWGDIHHSPSSITFAPPSMCGYILLNILTQLRPQPFPHLSASGIGAIIKQP